MAIQELQKIASELTLFAASGYILFGIEDFVFDLIWLTRVRHRGKAKSPVLGRRGTEAKSVARNLIAVFVPAWREEKVISHMVQRCLALWPVDRFRIFVGCYPNDLDTIIAAEKVAGPNVTVVVLDHEGPTTKADCLNGLWADMVSHEKRDNMHFGSVLLHDAEDFVHPDEIDLFAALEGDWSLAQIPVIPLADKSSAWISGHYLDEFAEAHIKELPTRLFLGASLPSAGTGCAVNRKKLGRLAKLQGGLPFDPDSLTEDYELGLKLSLLGGECHFLRARSREDNGIVAVKSFFPNKIASAIRQKTRWTIGIALAGWDRIGWDGNWTEHWMRWRDRRSLLAACVTTAGYLGLATSLVLSRLFETNPISPTLSLLLPFAGFFFLWRTLLRFFFTTSQYGPHEGLIAILRIFVSNLISVAAAWRGVFGYALILMTGRVVWDKTDHHFPSSGDD